MAQNVIKMSRIELKYFIEQNIVSLEYELLIKFVKDLIDTVKQTDKEYVALICFQTICCRCMYCPDQLMFMFNQYDIYGFINGKHPLFNEINTYEDTILHLLAKQMYQNSFIMNWGLLHILTNYKIDISVKNMGMKTFLHDIFDINNNFDNKTIWYIVQLIKTNNPENFQKYIDCQDGQNETILYKATVLNDYYMVTLLVGEGANPKIKNCLQTSPFEVAVYMKRSKIVQHFLYNCNCCPTVGQIYQAQFYYDQTIYNKLILYKRLHYIFNRFKRNYQMKRIMKLTQRVIIPWICRGNSGRNS